MFVRMQKQKENDVAYYENGACYNYITIAITITIGEAQDSEKITQVTEP